MTQETLGIRIERRLLIKIAQLARKHRRSQRATLEIILDNWFIAHANDPDPLKVPPLVEAEEGDF